MGMIYYALINYKIIPLIIFMCPFALNLINNTFMHIVLDFGWQIRPVAVPNI